LAAGSEKKKKSKTELQDSQSWLIQCNFLITEPAPSRAARVPSSTDWSANAFKPLACTDQRCTISAAPSVGRLLCRAAAATSKARYSGDGFPMLCQLRRTRRPSHPAGLPKAAVVPEQQQYTYVFDPAGQQVADPQSNRILDPSQKRLAGSGGAPQSSSYARTAAMHVCF